MQKLKEKLRSLNFSELDCINFRRNYHNCSIYITPHNLKNSFVCINRIKSQQDIEDVKEAYNQLQRFLKELEQCQD